LPRAVDLQLLALSLVAGASVAGVASVLPPRRRVGALAVLVAVLVAAVGDRRLLGAVPRDLVDGWTAAAGGAVVATAVAWGSSRLPVRPTLGVPPVLPLALAASAGVWAGVPETSAVLLVTGVIGGAAAVLVLGRSTATRAAAVAIAVLPVGAAVVGAAGDPHALVGGLLCSGGIVALGSGPPLGAVAPTALMLGTGAQLAAALVAARQVAIVRDWGGTALAIAVVVGLSIMCAGLLRRGQGRTAA
jgi:hypothetical protein